MAQMEGCNYKKGGGKLDSPMNSGNKGVPVGGTKPGKQSWGKKGGIDSPMNQGNKGIVINKGFPSSPAPKD